MAGLKLDLSQVNKKSFPLPNLGKTLQGLRLKLHSGQGFFILKGLNPADFTREENLILYLGISSYIAEQRGRQNHDGSLLSRSHFLTLALAILILFLPQHTLPMLFSRTHQGPSALLCTLTLPRYVLYQQVSRKLA